MSQLFEFAVICSEKRDKDDVNPGETVGQRVVSQECNNREELI